jgi:hypothetical protein
MAPRSTLVWTSCSHAGGSRYDRFGFELCDMCHTVLAEDGTPNEGLEDCNPTYMRSLKNER